jgi:hypothetical protein
LEHSLTSFSHFWTKANEQRPQPELAEYEVEVEWVKRFELLSGEFIKISVTSLSQFATFF